MHCHLDMSFCSSSVSGDCVNTDCHRFRSAKVKAEAEIAGNPIALMDFMPSCEIAISRELREMQNIISDEEIDRVHANATFGDESKREVVAGGVLAYAFGFTTGNTQFQILLEHGLIKKPKDRMTVKTTLTQKGFNYLRAAYGSKFYDIRKLQNT